jgi:hypothetical protein
MSALPGKSDLAPKIAPRMAQVNVRSPIFSKDVSYPLICEGESSRGEITGVRGTLPANAGFLEFAFTCTIFILNQYVTCYSYCHLSNHFAHKT